MFSVRHVPCYAFRYTSVYHHLFDIRLNRDVAVRAVDDAAGIKSPTVVCHALNCRLVLSGAGYARKTALIEHIPSDARNAVRYRHARKPAAEAKHTTPDTCHAVRYRHACQPCTIIKRIVPDARYIGSDFNCLRFFYPDRVTIS